MSESFDVSLEYEVVEEIHLLRAFLKHVREDVFEEGLCRLLVTFKIAECHFRFNHPEFCKMACRVAVLCPEGRSECVDVLKCKCISLAFKLS